jgi:hypothetical protein
MGKILILRHQRSFSFEKKETKGFLIGKFDFIAPPLGRNYRLKHVQIK